MDQPPDSYRQFESLLKVYSYGNRYHLGDWQNHQSPNFALYIDLAGKVNPHLRVYRRGATGSSSVLEEMIDFILRRGPLLGKMQDANGLKAVLHALLTNGKHHRQVVKWCLQEQAKLSLALTNFDRWINLGTQVIQTLLSMTGVADEGRESRLLPEDTDITEIFPNWQSFSGWEKFANDDLNSYPLHSPLGDLLDNLQRDTANLDFNTPALIQPFRVSDDEPDAPAGFSVGDSFLHRMAQDFLVANYDDMERAYRLLQDNYHRPSPAAAKYVADAWSTVMTERRPFIEWTISCFRDIRAMCLGQGVKKMVNSPIVRDYWYRPGGLMERAYHPAGRLAHSAALEFLRAQADRSNSPRLRG